MQKQVEKLSKNNYFKFTNEGKIATRKVVIE